ncbi:hydrogenase iron-sulfur subunit [Methanomassiliicoccus luminyensis]|uniref:hydrogenase iron-sulfur subunit n=2 Tax=Methanomassiliicoccus luminyensis TaxID=1080712 RepID=UPI0011C963B4|nr:hydrogenase iron-sulfur subunit [Methanomassiliicoccus luminyensis]
MVHQSMIKLPGCKTGCGKEFDGKEVTEIKGRIQSAVDELTGEQRVLVMACSWRNYYGRDLEGLKKLADRVDDYRVIPVPCSGLVNPDWVAMALDRGADSVLVLGGHCGSCPYSKEVSFGEARLKEQVQRLGFDPSRVSIDWAEDDEPLSFVETVDRVADVVAVLGPPFR